MEKKYKHLTRDYVVSNEGTQRGTVRVTTTIRETGEVVDSSEMATSSFPDFINRKRCIIFSEEIRIPDIEARGLHCDW
jgi:hypothetical protein